VRKLDHERADASDDIAASGELKCLPDALSSAQARRTILEFRR
jgi:hypothetical protein